jgi:rhodanese-related sulfurtransferase
MVQNVSPTQTWEALISDPKAQLVDVRTDAEWNFVGLPDLQEAGKEILLIPWQMYPTMVQNPEFPAALARAGLTPENEVYFLCRSGARSMAAAQAAQAAGFPNVFNVADGFEGPTDADGHRGNDAGWKAEDLPWRQR